MAASGSVGVSEAECAARSAPQQLSLNALGAHKDPMFVPVSVASRRLHHTVKALRSA